MPRPSVDYIMKYFGPVGARRKLQVFIMEKPGFLDFFGGEACVRTRGIAVYIGTLSVRVLPAR